MTTRPTRSASTSAAITTRYAQKGIPVAFFFSGLHEDYHRPSDEVDRIDFVKLQKVARTVLAVAWTLANAPTRPALDAQATK